MKTEEQKPAVKLVQIKLSALTRVEYIEIVQVPADITQEELNDLVNKRYQEVDGGDFISDPYFWNRGECSAGDVSAGIAHDVQPTVNYPALKDGAWN